MKSYPLYDREIFQFNKISRDLQARGTPQAPILLPNPIPILEFIESYGNDMGPAYGNKGVPRA